MESDIVKNFYTTHPIKQIFSNRKEWEYISCGKGKKTIVLLPGGGQTAQTNFQLIEEFEKEYRVIAPTVYAADSLEECHQAINAILDREHVDNVILYGLSLGGIIAQTYTSENKNKVGSLIISHACTSSSLRYWQKVLIPLEILRVFLPLVPNNMIQYIWRTFARKIQAAGTSEFHKQFFSSLPKREQELLTAFATEYRNKFMTKRLLQTWIKLHHDYAFHKKVNPKDFVGWSGKILVLQTDNDPFCRDERGFKRLYPMAQIYTFHDTGHLTFFYQLHELVKVVKKFMNT